MRTGFPVPWCQVFTLARTRAACLASLVVGFAAKTTDPIGVFNLTLTNVVVGSRIHIETQSGGTELHDSVADATSETISLSAYASGSPYNDLRIKVRKGTGSPTYKPFETLATAIVGSQSIYIGQIADE